MQRIWTSREKHVASPVPSHTFAHLAQTPCHICARNWVFWAVVPRDSTEITPSPAATASVCSAVCLWCWTRVYRFMDKHKVGVPSVVTVASGGMAHSFTESQNPSTVGVGRVLCGSSSPTPLPKQGHPEQAAQHRGQAVLEYFQRRRIHNLSGQPVAGLCHPQREEVLPHVQMELPVLQFVPIAPCPVAGHHWKELGPILLTPTVQIFVSMLGPLAAFSRLNKPSSFSLTS